MKNLNLNKLSLSRTKTNANLPTAIFMTEGDDFRTSRITTSGNVYEINLYEVIEDAIGEGLININNTTGAVSELTNNGDGTFTHDSGAGQLVSFREGRSNIVDNGNGTSTITTSDGNSVIINNNVLTFFSNLIVGGNRIATYQDEAGTTTDINETVTSISANANQLEYVDEAGDTTIIDLSLFIDDTNLARIVNGTLDPNSFIATFTRDDGSTFTVDFSSLFSNAPKSRVDVLIGGGNTVAQHDDGTGLIANIQETITTMVDNGNGSFTYTNELGIPVNFFGTPETLTTLVNNGDNTFTYTNENNTQVIIDYGFDETITTLVDNGNGSFTYTSEDGTITTYTSPETVTTLSYNPITGELTYINEDSAVTTVNLNDTTSIVTPVVVSGQIIANHDDGNGTLVNIRETVTSFTDNGDGTYTYTSEDGTTTTTTAPGQETVTTLVDNGDDTFTYTSENSTQTTIDFGFTETVTTLVDNLDNTYTYTNENGVQVTFSTVGETITTFVDNGDGSFTYTSENGTITTIPAPTPETITTLVDNGNGTFTYTNENSTPVIIDFGETITNLIDNGNGTYTYTNELGIATVITIPEQTLSIITNTISGNRIASHNDGTGNIINIDETITSIALTGPNIEYTDEAGNTTALDISGITNPSSVNVLAIGHPIAEHNDGDGTTVTLNETITSLSFGGTTLTYNDEEGNPTNIDLSTLQRARIISGTLSGGNITFTRDDATNFVVDVSALQSNQSIVDQTISGNQIARHNDGDGNLTIINETITSLGFAGTDLTYTDESGSLTVLDLSSLSQTQARIVSGTLDNPGQVITLVRDDASEIDIDISSLYSRESQVTGVSLNTSNPIVATHTSANGVVTNIRETLTSLSVDPNFLSYTNENGSTIQIAMSAFGSTSVIDNTITGNRIARHQDGNGINVDIDETITSLTLSGTNLTYDREGGTQQIIDLSGFNASSTYTNTVLPIDQHGIGTHDDGLGNLTTVYETNTSLSFSSNTLTYTDERSGDTNIDLSIYDNGVSSFSIDTLPNQPSGSPLAQRRIGVHTSGDGTTTDINESVTELFRIGNSLIFTDETATERNIDLSGLAGLSYSNINPAGNPIITITSGGIGQDINETITSLSLSGNTLTYTDETGVLTNLLLPTGGSGATSVWIPDNTTGHRIGIHNDGAGTFENVFETVTSISLSGNVLTYTDENGTDTDLTLPTGGGGSGTVSIMTDLNTGEHQIASHNDQQGNIVSINETITSISLSGNTLTYEDETGSLTNLNLPTGGGGGSRSGIFSSATSNTILAIPNGYHSIVWDSNQSGIALTLAGSPTSGDTVEVIRLSDNGSIIFLETMIDIATGSTISSFPVADSTISRFVYVVDTWYCSTIG